jgi:hypothetical protein
VAALAGKISVFTSMRTIDNKGIAMLAGLFVRHIEYRYGSVCKDVECENCGATYCYDVWRLGKGQAFNLGHAFNLLSLFRVNKVSDVARRQAEENLRQRLAEVEPVSCPRCGWYQRAMMPKLKTRRHVWTKRFALVLLLGPIAVLGVLGSLRMSDGVDAPISWGLLVNVATLSAAMGLLLLGLRHVLVAGWDPNDAPMEMRHRADRGRAFLPAQCRDHEQAHQAAEEAHRREYERLLQTKELTLFDEALIGVAGSIALMALMFGMFARSMCWSSTMGTIQEARVTTRLHWNKDNKPVLAYSPFIEYVYTVDGIAYKGNQHAFKNGWSFDESAYRDLLERFPPGAAVEVYFDPAEPAESVLDPGNYVSQLLGFLVAASLGIACLGWSCHCTRRWARRWKLERLLNTAFC